MSHVQAGLKVLEGTKGTRDIQIELLCIPEALLPLLQAAICHHGRPAEAKANFSGWGETNELDPPREVQRLIHKLLQAFPNAESGLVAIGALYSGAHSHHHAAQHAICGLTVLSDWIGSNTEWFPHRDSVEQDRIGFARRAAAHALREMGLQVDRLNSPPRFEDAFEYPPRGLQRTIVDLPLPEQASVTVFEAATGAGKTEAALHWFSRLHQAGLVDGLYFALPMRTAAIQLYDRVLDAAQRLWGSAAPQTVLAVPGYHKVDGWAGEKIGKFDVRWENIKEPGRTWACQAPIRFLAAPLAVGTIDQLLLGALKTKWSHYRGVCALRQLLVIDEVHASDTYMGKLLHEVILRQRKAGGHVLLLSATLGSSLRHRLFSETKRTIRPHPLQDEVAHPFPCVWTDGANPIAAESEGTTAKVVKIDSVVVSDPTEAMVERACEAVRAGARVLLIRNTVRGAIQTLEALGRVLNPALLLTVNGRPAPHHSRFAASDRQLLDTALLDRLGKQADATKRSPVVAVTTQTAEQSLDLDADLLITDLCPMDVLLQRIGRMHRHEAERPVGFSQACAVVVTRRGTLGERGNGQGHGLVYHHIPILACTLDLVQQAATSGPWVLPRDNRGLVERATHDVAVKAAVTRDPSLEDRRLEALGRIGAELTLARAVTCSWSRDFAADFPSRPPGTRLGVSDAILEVRPPLPSPFDSKTLIRQMKVPIWMLAGETAPPDDAFLHARAGRLFCSWSKQAFIYGPAGLATADSEGAP